MKPTTPTTLTERLQTARQEAVATKITLRHAQNDASDYLTWLGGEVDYKSLGGSDGARKKAFEAMIGGDERASTLEKVLRLAEDEDDLTQCALDCVLDEKHVANDQTWATLADWVKDRGQPMGSREQAGQEMLKDEAKASLVDALADYHERYGSEEFVEPLPEEEPGESEIPF